MLKIFFPALGVGFSELRQIALTLCHSIVNEASEQFTAYNSGDRRSFAHDTARDLCFGYRYEHPKHHPLFSSSPPNKDKSDRLQQTGSRGVDRR
jgi:hypothetical protein